MFEFLKQSDKVLILSDESSIDGSAITVDIKKAIGENGEMFIETLEMLLKSNRSSSSIDVIFYADCQPSMLNNAVLKKLFQILKSKGVVVLLGSNEKLKKLKTDCVSKFRLNGFLCGSSEIISTKTFDDLKIDAYVIVGEKPTYETGSSIKLSFGEKPKNMWKLTDDDDDDNIIDEADLLDENDAKKPAELSLRVCSTTGKRKACKDCSCGLSEELNGKAPEQSVKSSCGSCYLGDAFRCATCPYLGMAAFKPGEKIILEDSQLLNI